MNIFTNIITITLIFSLFDIVTGLIYAYSKNDFKSKIMREGLFHKAGCFLIIVLARLIDYSQTVIELGFEIELTKYICIYIILMEIGSIVENIIKINPELKDKVNIFKRGK